MDYLNVVLLVIGVLFACIIMVLTYYLWKYVNLERKRSYEKKAIQRKDFLYSTDFPKPPIVMTTTSQQTTVRCNELNSWLEKTDMQNRKFEQKILLNRTLSRSLGDIESAERRNSSTISPSLLRKKFGMLPRQSSFESIDDSDITRRNSKQLQISSRLLEDLRRQCAGKSGRRSSNERFCPTRQVAENFSYNDFDDSGSCYNVYSGNYDIEDSPSLSRRVTLRRGSSTPSYRRVGQIILHTEYNELQCIFRLHVKQVILSLLKKEESEIATFVRLYLVPGKKQKQQTRIIRATREPNFEELFKFVNLERGKLEQNIVKLRVYNSHMIKNDLVGETSLFLGSLDTSLKETYTLDLLLKKSQVSEASILVTLCHQGTFSKLEVIIQEAKNLPKRTSAVNINPYIVVSLYKEESIETMETHHQTNEQNPVFNESFDFNLQTDHANPLSTYSLLITVMYKSLVRKDLIVGHVIFSLSSPQDSAVEQWKILQAEPHKRYSQWHNLIDPEDL